MVTHNNPEGIKGAKAIVAAIYLARIGKTKAEIKDYIERVYGYELNRTLDEIRPGYRFNESCQGTVPEAITAFLESTDFEDAIRNSISLGGDSDTIAAITGSIAEAAYGVPGFILTKAFRFMDGLLSSVINNWIDNGKPLGAVIKKSAWKTNEFYEPCSINVNYKLDETQYARVKFGLCPEINGDKWFAYYNNGRMNFHNSLTGNKHFEAEIRKSDSNYTIFKLIVEGKGSGLNPEDFDLEPFKFLLYKGLLGERVTLPFGCNDAKEIHRWHYIFGRMFTDGEYIIRQ